MNGIDFSVTVYRKNDGMVISTTQHSCSPEHKPAVLGHILNVWGVEDHALVEMAADASIHYITVLDDMAVVAERPDLIVRTEDDKTTLQADGIDTIVLTGLPDPCEIIIDDPDPDVETTIHTVSGGGFVFVADDPGVYSVEVRRWPFLPFLIEFTAI